MSKSIREISQMDGRVYIRFRNKDSAKRFLFQATQEGFLFTDGVKPTEKPVASVIAVNKDYCVYILHQKRKGLWKIKFHNPLCQHNSISITFSSMKSI